MSADAPEVYSGMIDRLLALRTTPITASLLADLNNGRAGGRTSARWRAHQEAVDACIDAVMPSLRRLLALPATGGEYVKKSEVELIVGRVPFDRKEKYHTGDWSTRP